MTHIPFFSVIIPTKNRPEMLEDCLSSLCGLNYPTDRWELFIVDDGSQQSMEDLVSKFATRLPLHFIRLTTSAGPAAARNFPVKRAVGDHLAFLDDDCRVTPDWLTSYAAGFRETQKNALGGSSRSLTPDSIGARVWHHLIEFLYECRRDQHGNVLIIISHNCAYQRDVFLEIGGFDESFSFAASEDRDISWRLLEKGYTQGFYPAAKVWHAQPHLTLARYLKLQFRYGRSANRFLKRRSPATMSHFSKRFKGTTRMSYAAQLFRFCITRGLPLMDSGVLFLGHIFHLLGILYERSHTRITGRDVPK